MPNWIEGTMKLRGKRDDIRRFIYEGIHGYDFLGENERPKNEYSRFCQECGRDMGFREAANDDV